MKTPRFNYFPDKEKLQEQLSKLPEKRVTIKMVDFDDTIFSRFEQLHGTDDNSIALQKNRGLKCRSIINDVIGIDNYIEQYFIDKQYPKTIIESLNPEYDLILTAGYEDIQKAKIKATNLEYMNLEIVLHGEEKPQRLVEYIIKLGFIPSKIEIYEDRPQNFEAVREDFQELVGTILDIYLVEMENNHTPPKITKK